jgi:hypothetical protein
MSPEWMAGSGQESTARPVLAPTARWSEFTKLSRQVRQAGLLERRRGWYAARIGLNAARPAGHRHHHSPE